MVFPPLNDLRLFAPLGDGGSKSEDAPLFVPLAGGSSTVGIGGVPAPVSASARPWLTALTGIPKWAVSANEYGGHMRCY